MKKQTRGNVADLEERGQPARSIHVLASAMVATMATLSKQADFSLLEQFLTAKNVGRALAVIRVKKRITQTDLAMALSSIMRKAGRKGTKVGGVLIKGGDDESVSQSYISKIEKGKKNLSLARLALICYLLDCSMGEIFTVAAMLASHVKVGENELHEKVANSAKALIK